MHALRTLKAAENHGCVGGIMGLLNDAHIDSTMSPTSCVTWGKLPGHPVPQTPQTTNENPSVPDVFLRKKNENQMEWHLS